MSIRKKFFCLAGLIGAIMIVISCIGYYIAYKNLSEAVDANILANTEASSDTLDGWLRAKAKVAKVTATMLTELNGNTDFDQFQTILGLASKDNDVVDIAVGKKDGYLMTWKDGNQTGRFDPRGSDWFKNAESSQGVYFTNVYSSHSQERPGVQVLSISAPFYKDHQFDGAVCIDIDLHMLQQHIDKLKYKGKGNGFIVQKDGTFLAVSDKSFKLKNVSEDPSLKQHFDQMLKNKNGYFVFDNHGRQEVVGYTTLPTTGWVVVLSVPTEYVFAPIRNLQIAYALLSIIGIIITVAACLAFSNKFVKIITNLKETSDEIAKGNLRVADAAVETNDELGVLTQSINTMKQHVRDLIGKMSSTAEQMAASSEQLTASAQQSAEASNHVAQTVTNVAEGMATQMQNINEAKTDVDKVCTEIQDVADKTQAIAVSSNKTAQAAKQGETLMQQTIDKMGHIEENVNHSSQVVKKLGDNSQQIGQIVDTISAIADQTNLLALNAAIEAARAGEHGKGFAVVAEEVRKLAVESQSSAEEIKNRISAIQADTEDAVNVMEGGTKEVQQGTESIRNVGAQFTSIMQMVNGIKTQMDDINCSVQAVSDGAQHIVTAVASIDKVSRKGVDQTQSISAATEEQSASTEEIASASNALAHLSNDLKSASEKFTI